MMIAVAMTAEILNSGRAGAFAPRLRPIIGRVQLPIFHFHAAEGTVDNELFVADPVKGEESDGCAVLVVNTMLPVRTSRQKDQGQHKNKAGCYFGPDIRAHNRFLS
jgi:hypothetical protein